MARQLARPDYPALVERLLRLARGVRCDARLMKAPRDTLAAVVDKLAADLHNIHVFEAPEALTAPAALAAPAPVPAPAPAPVPAPAPPVPAKPVKRK